MKIEFAKRIVYRKKSERLTKWIFWGGMACSFYLVGTKVFQGSVTPTEDPHSYATQYLSGIISDKFQDMMTVGSVLTRLSV